MGWACASGVPLSSVGVTGGCGSVEGSFTFRNCSSRCRWAQGSDGQSFWFMRGHDFLVCPPGADSVVFLVIIALGTGGLSLQCLDNFWRLLLSHVFAGASCVLVLRRSRWWPCLHVSLFFSLEIRIQGLAHVWKHCSPTLFCIFPWLFFILCVYAWDLILHFCVWVPFLQHYLGKALYSCFVCSWLPWQRSVGR